MVFFIKNVLFFTFRTLGCAPLFFVFIFRRLSGDDHHKDKSSFSSGVQINSVKYKILKADW